MQSRPSFDTILESAQDSITLARQLAAEIEGGADIDLCATLSRELFGKVQPLAMIFDQLAGVLLSQEQQRASEAPDANEAAVDNVVAMVRDAATDPEEGSA